MRGLLPRILLLAVPVVIGCSTSDSPPTNTSLGFLNNNNSDCTQHTHLTVSIDEPAPPAAQLRIESCRVDQDACMDLCVFALDNLSKYPEWMGGVTPPSFGGGDILPPGGQIPASPQFQPSVCKVTFDGSTAHAEIAIDTPKFGPGCAVEAGTADGSGSGAGGAPSPGGL